MVPHAHSRCSGQSLTPLNLVVRFTNTDHVSGRESRLASIRSRNWISFARSNFQLNGHGRWLDNSSYSRRRRSTSARLAKSFGVRTFRCTSEK